MSFSHPDVQIKGYKTHRGHEGEPLAQGFLHFRGKKVIDWSEGDWGGPFQVHVLDKSAVPAFVELARKQLEGRYNFLQELYAPELMSDDELIEEYTQRVTEEFGSQRQLEKETKKGTVILFRRAGQPDGAYYVTNLPYTAANVARIRAKHSDVTEIINETLGQAFLSDEDVKAGERAAWLKRMQTKCRKSTVFGIKQAGSAEPSYRIIARPYSAALATQIRAQHGENLVEIVNERFL